MGSQLTVEDVRARFEYDPSTGELRWKRRIGANGRDNGRYGGTVAGSLHPDGYVIVMVDGRNYRAHTLAWAHMTGEWPEHLVDHINGIRSDNRFVNLRRATPSDNGCNKRMQSNNRSGFVGVWFNSQAGKWEGQIVKEGRRLWRKRFDTMQEAADARARVIADMQGDFAPSNPAERARYKHRRDRHLSPPIDW